MAPRPRGFNGDSSASDDDLVPYRRTPQQRRTTSTTNPFPTDSLVLPPDFEGVDFTDDERMGDLREKPGFPADVLRPRPYEDVPICDGAAIIPAPIAQYLKPYQIEGADFLFEKYMHRKGCILGDDMGLGKTIQVIAFMTAAFGKTGDERDAKRMRKMRREGEFYPKVLIICPGALMANWANELDRWGWWKIYKYHGNPAAKEEAIAAAENGRLEVMITTYTTYKNNEEAINNIGWDCAVADECHMFKERKSETSKAMNNLNAWCRIGLSGTAIQNKYEELWTLLNWTNPGALGPISQWKTSICVPLKVGQSHDATISQLSKARRIATKLAKHLLPKFFIRRTKALIAHQLPKKSDRVIFCPLTEKQAEAYNNFCDSELLHVIRDSSSACACGSGKKSGYCCYGEVDEFGPWKNHVFPVLHSLQKLSNHLGLLLPSGTADPEKHEKELQRLKLAVPNDWKRLYEQRDNLATFANAEFCGKWKVMKRLLDLWHKNGDKVLIFSHSTRLLKMLHKLFQFTAGYNLSYLDGSMGLDDRQNVVEEFNTDPSSFAFLISTKAGGVGLNITSANKVVVVDPNWNPAWDQQAQDRAYRIGQTRDVEVFRLISVGTVEEIVYARQIYKQQQANIGYNASVERRYFKGVQDQKDQKGEIFGLSNLFAPMKQNVVLRDIVNKTNVAESRAGYEIAGLDLEASQEDDDSLALLDVDDPRAAMSQLAASIIDEPGAKRKVAKELAKKQDPVQAILASAGVEYSHENAEVIGTSKIETKISSRAQKAGNDTNYINELAFAKGESQVDVPLDRSGIEMADDDAVDMEDGLGKIRYKFHPPADVRKRQFCTMAKQFGYDDVTEFALVVEGWTQEQRRDCLEKFYLGRRAKLAEKTG